MLILISKDLFKSIEMKTHVIMFILAYTCFARTLMPDQIPVKAKSFKTAVDYCSSEAKLIFICWRGETDAIMNNYSVLKCYAKKSH